jgi:phosphoglycolate phosphatase (TIGR01487 family)
MPLAGDYRAVAFDYDGTLTDGGRMSAETAAALVALRQAGYRLILVSGRRLERIRAACSRLDLFDEIILENGAVAFCPATGAEELIAPPLDAGFLAELCREIPQAELFTGRSMLATGAEHADRIRAAIGRGGYRLDMIGCGERVLVLPQGVDKGSGLAHALERLGLRGDQVIVVGDEANDLALFGLGGFSVAVGNAAPELKAAADLVMAGEGGQGVQKLIGLLLAGRL